MLLCFRWIESHDPTLVPVASPVGDDEREMDGFDLRCSSPNINDNDNDNGNDTLIEDGSNMCWTSGTAGMSDGVMTPRKCIGNLMRC